MPKEFKNYIPLIQQLVSVVVFVILLCNHSLAHASLWAIVSLYCWMFIRLHYKSFKLKYLIRVLSLWGILYAAIIFFLLGVEEVPYPEGAIFFHINYIALSVGLFFISSLPLMFGKSEDINNYFEYFSNYFNQTNKNKQGNEPWEEATISDLESGDFEPI